jgi:hypothetical protein
MSTTADLTFLQELDERTHKISLGTYVGQPVGYHLTTDARLSSDEVGRILNAVRTHNLLLFPTTTNFGFRISFSVVRAEQPTPGVDPDLECLLLFGEKQLPPEHSWETLSEVFLGERNRELMDLYGLPPIRDRVHYEY